MNADNDQRAQSIEPRVVHAPTPDIDWDALEYLDCYLITEVPPAAEGPSSTAEHAPPRLAVAANRRPLGTTGTLAEGRDLITRHVVDSLIFVEEHDGGSRAWSVAVTDQPAARDLKIGSTR